MLENGDLRFGAYKPRGSASTLAAFENGQVMEAALQRPSYRRALSHTIDSRRDQKIAESMLSFSYAPLRGFRATNCSIIF